MNFEGDPSVGTLVDELRKSRAEALQAARDLELAQQLLSAFLNHHPGLAFIKDEAGRYLYANENFGKFFGVQVADIIGKTDFDWLPRDLAAQFTENDRIVRRTGKPLEVIESVPGPTGIVRSLVNKFPIADKAGGYLVGGTAIDISDRITAEDELRAHNVQLTDALRDTRKTMAHAEKILCGFVDGEIGPLMPEQERILGMLRHSIRELLSQFKALLLTDSGNTQPEAPK